MFWGCASLSIGGCDFQQAVGAICRLLEGSRRQPPTFKSLVTCDMCPITYQNKFTSHDMPLPGLQHELHCYRILNLNHKKELLRGLSVRPPTLHALVSHLWSPQERKGLPSLPPWEPEPQEWEWGVGRRVYQAWASRGARNGGVRSV